MPRAAHGMLTAPASTDLPLCTLALQAHDMRQTEPAGLEWVRPTLAGLRGSSTGSDTSG